MYSKMVNEKNQKGISIIIPVYNQQHNISTVAITVQMIIDTLSTDYEIIIVNDGSTDRTLEVIEELRNENYDKIKVVSYPKNRGKGYAVRSGIALSTGSIVMYLDGDMGVNPDKLRDYLAELAHFDLVIASKKHPQSKIEALKSRRIESRLFNMLVSSLLGLRIKDTQSGLKVGNGKLLRLLFENMRSDRYAFDVELILLAQSLKLRIKEMPISLKLDRRFKINDVLIMAKDVLLIFFRSKTNHSSQMQNLSLNLQALHKQAATDLINNEEGISLPLPAQNLIGDILQGESIGDYKPNAQILSNT